jgi:hypothetical protein
MPSATYAVDRTLRVEPGQRVCTEYVDVFKCRLACRERMAVGGVGLAYQKSLQLAPAQQWLPPVGAWDGDNFIIHDGRHQWVAAVMLGYTHILVAWVIDADM